MSTLDTVNREIIDARLRGGGREPERRRHRLIHAIDAVMADLEEFHLAGRKRLPRTYEARLGNVATLLSAADLDVPRQMTIARVMDVLYRIQGTLLAEKTASLFGNEVQRRAGADETG